MIWMSGAEGKVTGSGPHPRAHAGRGTSPARAKERVFRFKQYAACGAPEFWIVDPERQTVEVFALSDASAAGNAGAEPRYEAAGVFTPGTPVRSPVLPDFACDPAEVFRP